MFKKFTGINKIISRNENDLKNFLKQCFTGLITLVFFLQIIFPMYCKAVAPACNGKLVVCPVGFTGACTSGLTGAPGCVVISGVNTPGCNNFTPFGAFFPGEIICIPFVSSSSSSSSSGTPASSSSSSSGILGIPFCSSGMVACNGGIPACSSGYVPICGSILGFKGSFAGPGCYLSSRQYFDPSGAMCVPPTRAVSSFFKNHSDCLQKNLCRVNNKRTEPCRNDFSLCKCACAFTIRYQKQTPRCSKAGFVVCSGGSVPKCTKITNLPRCYEGKLVCQDIDVGTFDLSDIVYCKK